MSRQSVESRFCGEMQPGFAALVVGFNRSPENGSGPIPEAWEKVATKAYIGTPSEEVSR